MTKECELLVTTKTGPILAGVVILNDTDINYISRPDYKTLMEDVMSSHVATADGRIDRQDDPVGWFEGLPKQYHGSYLRAKIRQNKDGENS